MTVIESPIGEHEFRENENLRDALKAFLDSPAGAHVLHILSKEATINPNKKLPVKGDAEMLQLTFAEYHLLLGYQKAIDTITRLSQRPKKVAEVLETPSLSTTY